MNLCPKCSAALKLGKREDVGRMISRYRSCTCGYHDRAYYEPERLLRTETVRQRTKSAPKSDATH